MPATYRHLALTSCPADVQGSTQNGAPAAISGTQDHHRPVCPRHPGLSQLHRSTWLVCTAELLCLRLLLEVSDTPLKRTLLRVQAY